MYQRGGRAGGEVRPLVDVRRGLVLPPADLVGAAELDRIRLAHPPTLRPPAGAEHKRHHDHKKPDCIPLLENLHVLISVPVVSH